MADPGGQRHDTLAGAERRVLDALAGVEALLGPGAAGAGGLGLRMIVAERQVRELARAARDDVLGLLAEKSLGASDQRLGVALLHTTHAIASMCDEYVDLSRLGDLPAPDDAIIADALVSMRELTRGQIRTAAESLAHRNGELAAGLVRVHSAIEALNHQIGDHGLVADDGVVRHEALASAVLTAECLTRISEEAVDIAERVPLVAAESSSAGHAPFGAGAGHSPV